MDAKEQYMQLRAARTGLVLDQIAFYAPDLSAVNEAKSILGLRDADWTEDFVNGRVSVFDEPETASSAQLLFNYDLGIEVEILTYMNGPNWHRHRDLAGTGPSTRTGSRCFVSHIGFHVNDGDIPILPWSRAQHMITEAHSNPAIKDRRYEYLIYDTVGSLGVDLKYIKRLS